MSKVAEYLNEHLLGEVTTNNHIRRRFATDGSVLSVVPDMVVYPRSTSDIRKVARFCWQLADKGHKLSITARGGGTDQTGAAIGSGVIIDTMAHLNEIFEIDVKQKLVRVQPGVTFKALNDALRLHGLCLPSYPASYAYSTIGGAIANNASGANSGKYGSMGEWISKLEVILSNGEVLQTGRIGKRELEKRKGLQTFEGEIYRSIDHLIEDNLSLIDTLAVDVRDNVGYNIMDVKRRDGSVDLLPLFVGSQGTIGIVSEVILKVEPIVSAPLVCAFAFDKADAARDALDILRSLDPSVLELIDGRLFEAASDRGKTYGFYKDAVEQGQAGAVIVAEFDNSGDHIKKKIAKKIAKLFEDNPAYIVIEREPGKAIELQLLRQAAVLPLIGDKSELSTPPILEGSFVPADRFEDFAAGVAAIEAKHHVELPLFGHASQHVYFARPLLNFSKVGDRQKVFKLLVEWSTLVNAHGGHLVGEAGEGRLKAAFAYKNLDDDTNKLFSSVRELFDPFGIMNTGVKQVTELKKLAEQLRGDYDGSDFAVYGVHE